jgi:hypothetical protein
MVVQSQNQISFAFASGCISASSIYGCRLCECNIGGLRVVGHHRSSGWAHCYERAGTLKANSSIGFMFPSPDGVLD